MRDFFDYLRNQPSYLDNEVHDVIPQLLKEWASGYHGYFKFNITTPVKSAVKERGF